jgi:hypothetical protein
MNANIAKLPGLLRREGRRSIDRPALPQPRALVLAMATTDTPAASIDSTFRPL